MSGTRAGGYISALLFQVNNTDNDCWLNAEFRYKSRMERLNTVSYVNTVNMLV